MRHILKHALGCMPHVSWVARLEGMPPTHFAFIWLFKLLFNSIQIPMPQEKKIVKFDGWVLCGNYFWVTSNQYKTTTTQVCTILFLLKRNFTSITK